MHPFGVMFSPEATMSVDNKVHLDCRNSGGKVCVSDLRFMVILAMHVAALLSNGLGVSAFDINN